MRLISDSPMAVLFRLMLGYLIFPQDLLTTVVNHTNSEIKRMEDLRCLPIQTDQPSGNLLCSVNPCAIGRELIFPEKPAGPGIPCAERENRLLHGPLGGMNLRDRGAPRHHS